MTSVFGEQTAQACAIAFTSRRRFFPVKRRKGSSRSRISYPATIRHRFERQANTNSALRFGRAHVSPPRMRVSAWCGRANKFQLFRTKSPYV